MLRKQKNQRDKKPESKEDIGKVLGLMEEKGKGKEWLLEQIRRHRVKLNVSPTANSFEILTTSSSSFVTQILQLLKGEEYEIEEPKELTKTMNWFFSDIVASADPTVTTKAQIHKINLLTYLTRNTETFKKRDPQSTVVHWSGDGMAIGFADSPENPLRLAIELHKELSKYNRTAPAKDRLYIRIGINAGPVYLIKDLENNVAVWGDGIIMARRVMDLAGQNQIFASAGIAEHTRKLSREYKSIFHPVGKYRIKHDEEIEIYSVFGKGFGNKKAPQKNKVEPQKPEEAARFEFNRVEVNLDVKDPRTMLTRHTYIWDVTNISKIPLTHIFYKLVGDSPKEFEDMNVRITDEKGNKLPISSKDINRPLEKNFRAMFLKPVRPKQRKVLKMEYDWEEPERVFSYTFSSKCKEFKYVFEIPKGVQINDRVLKIDPELGEKRYAEQPQVVKSLPNKTQITWQTSNLKANDTYEFRW